MSNAVAVIGLSYDGTDIQRSDFGIFLEIVRGLNEPPQVRGIDTVIPTRDGRVARARVADVLTIELRGIVTGRGTPVTAAETVAGANTTLTADVAAGASVIVVASATGISVGNFLRIGDTGETEIRAVAASYVSGTTIPLTAPLVSRHDSADTVREVDSVGSSGDRAAFRANVAIVRALFLPTRSAAVLVASLEDGTTATISARGMPSQLWEQVMPELANVSIELESIDPDWVIT